MQARISADSTRFDSLHEGDRPLHFRTYTSRYIPTYETRVRSPPAIITSLTAPERSRQPARGRVQRLRNFDPLATELQIASCLLADCVQPYAESAIVAQLPGKEAYVVQPIASTEQPFKEPEHMPQAPSSYSPGPPVASKLALRAAHGPSSRHKVFLRLSNSPSQFSNVEFVVSLQRHSGIVNPVSA